MLFSDLNLEVADREFLVLAGLAGSGTSAVLRLIAGLEHPVTGDILIGDQRVNGALPQNRDVALLFSSYALYPHLTVQANLAFGLKIRHYPAADIQKRVREAASLLGLEAILEARPELLSPSQQLRVALGRGIVRRPKVYLLDDPFANLDGLARPALRTELLQLQQRLQTTFICTTHAQADVMALGCRTAILQAGAIQPGAAPLMLYQEPPNQFVAGFLGDPAMNFVSGKLTASGERLIFKEVTGGVLEYAFPEQDRPVLRGYAGREIVLGIRPEDIALSQNTPGQPAAAFQCVVDRAEAMGAETFFQLDTGRHRLVCRARTTADPQSAGHRQRFQLDTTRVHFFDPATTNRIV